MQTTLNAERVTEIASEYGIAYRQLQHVDQESTKLLATLERDRELALKRYQMARRAFLEIALGEDDEYLEEAGDAAAVQPPPLDISSMR